MKISVRRWIRGEMLRSGIEHTADLAIQTTIRCKMQIAKQGFNASLGPDKRQCSRRRRLTKQLSLFTTLFRPVLC